MEKLLKGKSQILHILLCKLMELFSEKIYLQMFSCTNKKIPQLHWKFKQMLRLRSCRMKSKTEEKKTSFLIENVNISNF